MPRPRVPPENRIRAYRACDPCKASKTRCDSKLPCAACNKPSRMVHCAYSSNSASSSATSSAGRKTTKAQRPNSTQTQQRPLAANGPPVPAPTPGSQYAAGSTVLSPPRQNGYSDARTRMSSMVHTDRSIGEEDDPESPQEQLVIGSDGEKRKSFMVESITQYPY